MRLRPLAREHAALEARWMADAEVRHWLHRSEDGPEYRTRAAIERKIGEVLADPTELRFVIETREGVPIGDVGLLGIHPHGRAELSIKIGEKSLLVARLRQPTRSGVCSASRSASSTCGA